MRVFAAHFSLAKSGELWLSAPGQCQECQPVRRARPGSATGARAGAQSHLHGALVGAGWPDTL
eukprot:scaffold15661_cov134-Isochrysis_galbana.AAC.2